MKLQTFSSGIQIRQVQVDELQALIAQPGSQDVRPCSGCRDLCASCGSSTCTCQCGMDCASAPRQMSIEPDRYPVEEKIAALVFELNCLRLCPPYWSCEGHVDTQGELLRTPQVWFHSSSLVYPRLIAELLGQLWMGRKLANRWNLSVAFSGVDELGAGFSIEPVADWDAKPDLAALQNDAYVIAENLVRGVRIIALRDISAESNRHLAG